MAKVRITITVPEQLLEAADRRAEELRRSRSWILAEALRRDLSEERSSIVREAPATYAAGPGPSRLGQLEADLALSPEERVSLAEETTLVAELAHPRRQRDQIVQFDSIESFHAWERREEIGR